MKVPPVLAIAGLFAMSLSAARPVNHDAWSELLATYVNAEFRVDYQALKDHDLPKLDSYLQQLAPPWSSGMTAGARKAALINAYNALTVRWIITNYPLESIWRTKHPFTEARHQIDGGKVSLDQIETRLRNMGDPRIHAALVCAARSCPPLRREAFEEDRVDAQLDDNFRSWLADPRLNEFFPDRRVAKLSFIFKHYAEDFRKNGESTEKYLARYVSSDKAAYLSQPGLKIETKPYDWGLNDVAGLGSSYTKSKFYWDYLRNK